MNGLAEPARSQRAFAALVAVIGTWLPSSGAFAAPVAGERYVVDGRCVTLSRVSAGQAYYAWNEGSRSGSGSLPAGNLGARCQAPTPAGGAEPAPAMEEDEDDAADMAPPPATAQATAAAGSGGDAAFRDEILRAHNQVRCMHGVPPLSWHPEVAAYAQNWVQQSGFSHSKSYASPLGPMGENLYGSSGQPGAGAAVSAWYNESRGYDYAGEGSSASGHFTALIWKDARYLGCARANGKLSCNYWAGGTTRDCKVPNMQGCYRAEVQPRVRDEVACRQLTP